MQTNISERLAHQSWPLVTFVQTSLVAEKPFDTAHDKPDREKRRRQRQNDGIRCQSQTPVGNLDRRVARRFGYLVKRDMRLAGFGAGA